MADQEQEKDMTIPARDGEEVWEMQLPGRVHIAVTNHLGRPADRTVQGKGSRLRIGTLDRQLAEEMIRLPENNPFRNGTLVHLSGGPAPVEDPNALSDSDLREIFAVHDGEFAELIASLTEVNVRRMKDMAKAGKPKGGVDATVSQVQMIADLIEERWPIGGSTPTYDEMNTPD